MGNCQIRSGSKVVTISNGSDAVVLFTLAQVRALFGHSDTTAYQYACFVCNGDGASSAHHLHGTTWLNNSLYILTKDVATANVVTRANYLIIYSPNATT